MKSISTKLSVLFLLETVFLVGLISFAGLHLFFQKKIENLDKQEANERAYIAAGEQISSEIDMIERNYYKAFSIYNQKVLQRLVLDTEKQFKVIREIFKVIETGGNIKVKHRLNLVDIDEFISREIIYTPPKGPGLDLVTIDLKPKLLVLENAFQRLVSEVQKRNNFIKTNNILPKDVIQEIKLLAMNTDSHFIRMRENSNRLQYYGTQNLEKLSRQLIQRKNIYIKMEIGLIACIIVLVMVCSYIIARQIELNKQDLIKATEAAEIANVTKSEFLANMSHEIRTPLNAVLGFLQIVLEDPSLSKTHDQYLKTAQTSATGLLSLINDILDISKLERGKLTIEICPFNLDLLMEEICQTLELKIQEKNLKLVVDIDPAISGSMMGDPLRLRQVIVNLVSNAIKFTEKGRICISVKSIKDRSQIQFSIEDTGIGIPEERLHSIFESFTQADSSTTRRYGGTGLGTTISKELVELMGGRIWAVSEVGKGSTFHFTIKTTITDRIPEKNDLFLTSDKSRYKRFRHGFRVLLVEDIKANVELAKVRLEKQNHEVTIAWNGRQAIEAVKSEKGFDVILMDIHMPEMNGIEATGGIRKIESGRGQAVPIIAMTAGVMKEEKESYLSAGMNAVVAKPVDFENLFTTMDKLVPQNVGKKDSGTDKKAKDSPVLEMPTLAGIDTKKGLKNWQDPKVYTDALLGFSQDYTDVVSRLRDLIEKNNLEEAYQITHALKGVAGNLSIVDVADIATVIDMAIRKEQLADIKEQISDLDSVLQTAINDIHTLKGIKNEKETHEKRMNQDELKEVLGNLLSAIDQFNPYEAEPFLYELQTVIPSEQLVPIKKYINQFDFKNARQEIEKLVERLSKYHCKF